MRLRPSVTADQAVVQLNATLGQLQNARSVPFRAMDPLMSLGPHGLPGRDNYLRVIDDIECQLRNLFVEPDFVDELHSERYWRIHELMTTSAMPDMVIQAEINAVEHRLKGWVEVLSGYGKLADRPGQAVAVLDTNAFMHYQLFTQIPWCDVLDRQRVASVRLVIPLIVLDQLDDKSYSAHKRLAKRANKILGILSGYLDVIDDDGVATVAEPVDGHGGVTLEILGEHDGHLRRANSDSEILDRAQFLSQVINREVVVVTADQGMRARGRARKLAVHTLADKYRLPLDDDDTPRTPSESATDEN